jgi:competence protein ComEC
MFKLRTGYLISGIITGLIILVNFIWTLPDGKLHLIFCNVGQGDAAYIVFPNGRDMLVDGGPDNKVIDCLSRHMPFWDKKLDMVVLSHPQKDHLEGLIPVLQKYQVNYFIRSNITNTSEGFKQLAGLIKQKHVIERLVHQGELMMVDDAKLTVLWPSMTQLAKMQPELVSTNTLANSDVLGATSGDLNDGCVVFKLNYGTFDALLPGDADSHVDNDLIINQTLAADGTVDIFKVPHHGAKTGMNDEFINWVYPTGVKAKKEVAVISVGKNSFGHPDASTLQRLADRGVETIRTDQAGDVEIVSDGKSWQLTKDGNVRK